MSTPTQDARTRAIALLQRSAAVLKESYTVSGDGVDWSGFEAEKAEHNEHTSVIAALSAAQLSACNLCLDEARTAREALATAGAQLVHYFAEWEQILPPDARDALRAIVDQAPDRKEAQPDMRAVCEALGFDPTNHHNAAKCPYCRPAEAAPAAAAELESLETSEADAIDPRKG